MPGVTGHPMTYSPPSRPISVQDVEGRVGMRRGSPVGFQNWAANFWSPYNQVVRIIDQGLGYHFGSPYNEQF